MPSISFPFRFDPVFRLAAAPLMVSPSNSGVTIDDDRVRIRFGRWTLDTERANVVAANVTGPYRLAKVIGPPHLSFSDRGITFATNADEGVCLRFARPVPAMLPIPLLRHPGATVTVDRPQAFAALFPTGLTVVEPLSADQPSLDDAMLEVHDDLAGRSASELRRVARNQGVDGASHMSKAELLVVLDPVAFAASELDDGA